jgi:hypothetical protein
MRVPTTVAFVLLSLCFSFCLAADNELTPEEKAAGWQLLFNGRDHDGWICNNGKPIATPIEDGCLAPFKSGGYIIMYDKKKFGDFVLKCDVKMGDQDCNSGIFFRVGAPRNPVYSGFEVQVENSAAPGLHAFGAIYDLVAPSKQVQRGPGEWNTVELTCRGPEIRVQVNGEETTVMNCDDFSKRGLRPDGTRHKFGLAIKDLPRVGYIGFQDHGHPVWYKNVKIRELKAE